MAEVATEEAKPGKADGDDVAPARKRLQLAIEATNGNRIFQQDDLRFVAGSPDNKFQWPEAIVRLRETDPNGARPVLTINKLPQHILQVTNEQRQNRPSIKVTPVDDKGDKEVAEVLTGIIRHIEYQSDAETAYATAGENQVVIGEGYLRVLTDYVDEQSFEQDVQIFGIKNSFSVYLDPLGLQKDATGRFCEWGFIVEDLAKEDFERQFPEAEAINWDLVGQGDEWKAWFPDSNTVRIAEYFCFEYETKNLSLYDVGGIPTVHLEGDPLPQGVVAVQKPLKTRKTQVKQLLWQKMNGQEVIEERKIPGRFIPIVRMVGNEFYIDGRMVVAGLPRNAKDAQRMFNYWKSTEAETLALAPKSPYVGPAEAFEGYEDQWQQANVKNYAFLKYNAFNEAGEVIPRPERQVPPMPPIGIVNAALGAADDIKSATGQYDPSLGNNPQAKSGIALQREQRKTDMGTFHYIDNQARAIKQLGRILVDIVPKYYDTKRIARIIGEDGEADHVSLDPDAQQPVQEVQDPQTGKIEKIYRLDIGKYDVNVSVGPGYASKRQEAADFMAQVLQGNKELMAVMGDLYFKMLDVPGAEEISERLKKTLPPGLADDPEDGEPEPMVQTPQGPLPAQAASQLMAQMTQELMQAQEALKKAGDLQQEEMQVKEQAAALEMTKKDLEHMLGEIDMARKELELSEKLAEANLKCGHMENERALRDQGDVIREQTDAAKEQEAGGAQAAISELAQATAAVAQAVTEVARVVTLPRKNTMVLDGETLESKSEVVH